MSNKDENNNNAQSEQTNSNSNETIRIDPRMVKENFEKQSDVKKKKKND